MACRREEGDITLYRDLTDQYILSILVSIPDYLEEELWKFLDREEMKTLLESLEIDLEQLEEEAK